MHFVGSLLFLWIIYMYEPKIVYFLIVAFLGAFIFMGISTFRKEEKRAQRVVINENRTRIESEKLAKRQKREVTHILKKYAKKLSIKRKQLLVEDDYGDIDSYQWDKEKRSFLASKLKCSLDNKYIFSNEKSQISLDILCNMIDQVVDEYDDCSPSDSEYSDNFSGIDYEHFCAEILERSGWQAKVSQASNDQGADIIAKCKGYIVAIQCKKYSSPVGNKAVQEVIGSLAYYGANKAVVVTNNSYTTSAKRLASSNDALLLHHDDIPYLLEIIASDKV